ncbi:hypothetical protein [Mucilaginibacter sp.]|uniref:hypothetical protein n=1 Tax=Mucilaginibacter sp. TaxID=1882438 RepID=UPI00374D2EEE
MKKKQEFKLIEGEFTPQDAKEVLTNLYSSKINFHTMKNFSANERFGKNDEVAARKIPKLKESLAIISSIIQKADEKNKTLVITAIINVELIPVKK